MVRNPGALARIRDVIELEIGLDGAELPDRIAEAVMTAETADDVFDAAENGLQTAEEMVGQPLRLVAVKFNRSTFEGPLGAYAVITSVDHDGVTHEWKIGGTTAVMQLFKWDQLNKYPLIAVLFAKPSTANPGNTALFFRRPTPGDLARFDALNVPTS